MGAPGGWRRELPCTEEVKSRECGAVPIHGGGRENPEFPWKSRMEPSIHSRLAIPAEIPCGNPIPKGVPFAGYTLILLHHPKFPIFPPGFRIPLKLVVSVTVAVVAVYQVTFPEDPGGHLGMALKFQTEFHAPINPDIPWDLSHKSLNSAESEL